MGFDRREHAKRYTRQEGDTLQRIAERETAAGNPVTWQELARFNWGVDDPREVDGCLRDELGCRERDAANHYVISTEDEPRGELLIPVRFTRPGLALEKTYTLRVRRKQCPDQFLGCCSLPGVTFAFNSSFVRPTVVGHLKPLEALARAHPAAKIMIFGHTDAVGDDLYNKKLSERRAWSVHAFITNDADAWETLYNHADEAWGVPVVQEILADLGHDPGPVGGGWDSQTRAAARAFLGLPDGAPVANDATFRKQLFAAYMASKHDVDLPRERFMAPGYMGCGEFNPVEASADAQEANRRVTFFFFHPDRLPNLPCAYADVAPCARQMVSLEARNRPSFRCSFYDSWARSCPGEGKNGTIVVLFHVPEEARERQRALDDWYVLDGTPVPYRRLLYTRDAEVVAPNRMALVFHDTPLADTFTLRHHYDAESDYVVFESRSHADLVGYCGTGDACEDEEDVGSAGGDEELLAADATPPAPTQAAGEGDDPDADESWFDPQEIVLFEEGG